MTSSNSMSTVGIGDTVTLEVDILPASGETITASTMLLYYSIGSGSSFSVTPTPNSGSTTKFSYTHSLANGENGAFDVDAVRFETDSQTIANYTIDTAGNAMLNIRTEPTGGLTATTPNAITDPTSIDVTVSATGTPGSVNDEITVINTETINIGVKVVGATDAVLAATGNTLQYDIAGSGTTTDLALSSVNATHFTTSLQVTTAIVATGLFSVESVKLNLNNGAGDAVAEVKTYTTSSTPAVTVTTTPSDGLYIDAVTAAEDPTAIAVAISADGGDASVTYNENISIVVKITDSIPGKLDFAATTPVVFTYKIASGDDTNLTLVAGDNNTHWIGFVNISQGYTGGNGAFTFVSVTLALDNADADDNASTAKTFEESDNILTLTDAELTIENVFWVSNLASIDVNITADSDETLGIGDKITFTAKTVNGTDMDGNVLNITVHYKVNKTAGLIELTKGTEGSWSATLTITNNTGSGNLTFVRVDVGLENRDGMDKLVKSYDTAAAKITEELNITIDLAPADNTTASATTSATSSSETSSDSPVSIFAVFILIASVSMAVGVYTLRRRQ